MKRLEKIRDVFLLFIIFAICGWIYEVVGTMIVYGYFENRGFLFGPWLPIYGIGGLAVYAAFGRFIVKPAKPFVVIIRIFVLVVSIAVIAAGLELAASYLLDAVGIGYRTLWIYDGEPLNFDGRIGVISSLRFGIIGVVALYLSIPLRKLSECEESGLFLNIAGSTLAALFLADLAARFFLGSNMG